MIKLLFNIFAYVILPLGTPLVISIMRFYPVIVLYFILIGSVFSQGNLPHPDSLRKDGFINLRQGNYHTAMKNFYEALPIYEEQKDSSKYALTLTGIGILNNELGDHQQALDFFYQALDIYTRSKNEIKIAQLKNNIGLEYYYQGHYDSALSNLSMAIALKKKHNLHPARFSYANVGRVFYDLNLYDSALFYFNNAISALHDFESSRRSLDSMEILHDIGKVYYRTGQYQKSIDYFKKSHQLAKTYSNKSYIASNSQFLSITMESQGFIDSALAYNKAYTIYSDSLYREKNLKSIAKYETNYLINQINDENEKDIQQRNLIIYLSLGGILLLSLSIVAFYYHYQKTRDQERLIRKKNEEISAQKINKLLNEKELNTIKANIEGQEIERKRIAAELHDGVGGNLSAIKLSLSNQENINEYLQNLIQQIDKTSQEVRAIAHNLTPPSIQLTAFTHLLHDLFFQLGKNDSIEIDFHIHNEEQLNTLPEKYKIELYRIIQEASSNIVKHSGASQMEVQLIRDAGYINLIIEDNGKGFKPRKNYSGIGLKNMLSRVNLLGGSIEIDSELHRGTVINIEINLPKE